MMKRLSWLLLGGLLALGYGLVRENPKPRLLALFNRLPQADSAKSESAETEPQPAPQPATQPLLKAVSALAAWMGKDKSEQTQAGTFRTPKTAPLRSHRWLPGGQHEHHPA